MKNRDAQVSKSVVAIVLILVFFGGLARFANLHRKVFGYDESITLMRVAGFTTAETFEQLYDAGLVGVDDLRKFQRPSPERGMSFTIQSLARDVPQHPPLFFALARIWAGAFGASPAATKSLPAVIALLAFPLVLFLCRELFGSAGSGWIALGLLAVSPLQVLYAQEARPYSLLVVMILASSWLLLRALRIDDARSWIFYAIAATAGMYTHLLFASVLAAHGVYVWIRGNFRFRAALKFGACGAAVLLAFLPWLRLLHGGRARVASTMGWTIGGATPALLVKSWVGDFSRLFYDTGMLGYELSFASSPVSFVLVGLAAVAALGLTLYALWFLRRAAPRSAWWFVFLLIFFNAAPLIAADLVLDGQFSATGRYLIPAYLGVQLAVSHAIAAGLSFSGRRGTCAVWCAVALLIGTGGVVSDVGIANAEVWSNHGRVYHLPFAARAINQSATPVVVTDCKEMHALSLSHLLRSEARIQFIRDRGALRYDGLADAFLFRPSDELKKMLENDFVIEVLHERGKVWTLKHK